MGAMGYMVFKGPLKSNDYFYFLCCLAKFLMNKYREELVFFMDNAPIHKSKIWMKDKFLKNFYVLYNAPYSP